MSFYIPYCSMVVQYSWYCGGVSKCPNCTAKFNQQNKWHFAISNILNSSEISKDAEFYTKIIWYTCMPNGIRCDDSCMHQWTSPHWLYSIHESDDQFTLIPYVALAFKEQNGSFMVCIPCISLSSVSCSQQWNYSQISGFCRYLYFSFADSLQFISKPIVPSTHQF